MADSRINQNPWKGLNYYEEGDVLYGRNSEIESLSQFVINNTQTVLYGKSGIGKSSILNAGIFPMARQNGLIPIAIRLDHNSDTSYLRQIQKAIVNSGVDVHEIIPAIEEDKETLWEYMHRCIFFDQQGQRKQLLMVFDQFEEIFTLQKNEKKKRAFFDELADLLNDVMPLYIVNANKREETGSQHDAVEVSDSLADLDIDLDLDDVITESSTRYLQKIDYHIVFTIREDFLSYLERYSAYIPVMKTNRYALLPINEEQASDIIMKPQPGLVSKDVAELIIQKVTGQHDFKLDGIPEIEVDAAVLSLYLSRLYIKKGEAKTITASLVNQFSEDIIKDFYTESVADLPTSDVEEIEDQLLTYDGRRNNVSRNDLIREGVAEEVIRTLVEDRKLLRQFSYQDDIRVEFMHDILCPIVDERINQRELARQQEEERRLQEAERQKMAKKNRHRLIMAVATSVALVLLGTLYFLLFRITYSNNYAAFTTQNGWPVGIGDPLSGSDQQEMVVHYQLTRRGLLKSFNFMGIQYHNPYIEVQVLNKSGKPSTNKLIESPLVSLAETDGLDQLACSFAQMQLHTNRWRFTADEEGNMSRQTAYDINNQVLYSVQYYRATAENESDTPGEGIRTDEKDKTHTLWMNYVDPEGKSLRIRSNGADRMRMLLQDGFCVGYQFFSESGTPQRNNRNAYGYRYTVGTDGRVTAIIPLDEYGDPISGQSLTFTNFDPYGRWTKATGATASYTANSIVYTMPNRTDTLRYDDEGHQVYRSELIDHKLLRSFSYNSEGMLTDNSVYRIQPDGKMVLKNRITCIYGPDGRTLTERTEYMADAVQPFRCERYERQQNAHTITYWGGKSLSSLEPVNNPNGGYHRMTSTQLAEGEGQETVEATEYWTMQNGRAQLLKRETTTYAGNLRLSRVIENAEGRSLSLAYEIEDGVVVGQHVVGLDGDTIRCPQWDDSQLCYYRKKFVRNFAGDIVAVKAVNEFGEESLVTYRDFIIRISVVPGDEISKDGDDFSIFGIGFYKYSASKADNGRKVDYLHITDKGGTFWRCGLRDGDIILQMGKGGVKVARRQGNGFAVKEFHPQTGDPGMEHYPVYYTEPEMKRLRAAIATQEK